MCDLKRVALFILCVAILASSVAAQRNELGLSQEGWEATGTTEAVDEDEAYIREAWAILLGGNPGKARTMLNAWLRENRSGANQWTSLALLVRGDAKVAMNDEYDALYDYERIATNHAGSPEYIQAAERTMAIAIDYIDGKRRKFLGLRITNARREGAELLVRIAERLPGSQLAERATLELGAHYRRMGDYKTAGEVYGTFLEAFPTSTFYRAVLLARIETTFAQYNGPEYDGSGLIETEELLDVYERKYPGDLEVQAELDALRVRIDESQGRQLLVMAEVYLKRGEKASARYVLRRLLSDHPRTTAAQDALDILSDRGWLREGDGA